MLVNTDAPSLQARDATTVKDALEFLRRRMWLCVTVAVTVISAAVLLAFRLPPVYLSQATILIEQPAIPEDFVQSMISSYVDEQIQVVAQRVYTPESVMAIVEELDLYPNERQSGLEAAVVEMFVSSVYLESLSAEVTDDRGRSSDSTFAFIVGFYYSDAATAQQVTSILAERFLEENLSSRKERAAVTTTFLEQEAERLAQEMSGIEDRIAKFKNEYGDALPEQVRLNIDMLARTEAELSQAEQNLPELRAEAQILESQLRTLDPYAAVYSESGEPMFSADERLTELRQQYLQYTARYGPEHPDVVRTRREIETIVGSGNFENALNDVDQQRATLTAQLEQLLERYSPEHPDVVRLQNSIDALPSASTSNVTRVAPQRAPNNPSYLAAQAQLESIRAGISSAEQRRQELIARRARLERNIEMSPRVEQDWLQLNRGYNSVRLEFEEIKRRTTGARLSENLEAQNISERFTLLRRAGLPSFPVEPNRVAIIMLGIVFGLGAGIGLAALTDALDSTIRSAQDLQTSLAIKPIAVVPIVRTDADRRLSLIRRLGLVAIGVFGAATVFLLS